MNFLNIDGVHFRQGEWQLEVDLQAKRGECIGLIGPSGAGKSTLLSLIAGFEQAEHGAIFVNNNAALTTM